MDYSWKSQIESVRRSFHSSLSVDDYLDKIPKLVLSHMRGQEARTELLNLDEIGRILKRNPICKRKKFFDQKFFFVQSTHLVFRHPQIFGVREKL